MGPLKHWTLLTRGYYCQALLGPTFLRKRLAGQCCDFRALAHFPSRFPSVLLGRRALSLPLLLFLPFLRFPDESEDSVCFPPGPFLFLWIPGSFARHSNCLGSRTFLSLILLGLGIKLHVKWDAVPTSNHTGLRTGCFPARFFDFRRLPGRSLGVRVGRLLVWGFILVSLVPSVLGNFEITVRVQYKLPEWSPSDPFSSSKFSSTSEASETPDRLLFLRLTRV